MRAITGAILETREIHFHDNTFFVLTCDSICEQAFFYEFLDSFGRTCKFVVPYWEIVLGHASACFEISQTDRELLVVQKHLIQNRDNLDEKPRFYCGPNMSRHPEVKGKVIDQSGLKG